MVSSNFLLDYLASLLAPIFFEATGNDPTLACAAARQTIADYRARTGAELLLVGQIIALSVASISAAVQSMQDEIPPSVSQRLQTRASTLSRAADRARTALEASMRQPPQGADNTIPEDTTAADAIATLTIPAEPPQSAATIPAVARAPQPANVQAAGINPAVWRNSFADVAQELAASLASLSPRERQNASIQIAALEEAARSLNPAHRHR